MLNNFLEPGSQMRILYDALAIGQLASDEEVLEQVPEFYHATGKLSVIKSKLRDRLNNAMLMLDFRDAELVDRPSAFIECAKRWASSVVLQNKNARSAFLTALESLLRQAKRFEFTEIVIDVLRSLRLHSSIISGDRQAFNEYSDQLQEWEANYLKESHVERLYAEMMMNFMASRSDKRAMAEQAVRCFDEIKGYMNHCDTFKLQLFSRLIQISIYDNLNDYAHTLTLCEDAITYFKQKPYKSNSALQIFYYSRFVCLLNLRRYTECSAFMAEMEEVFNVGTFNWFKLQELYLMSRLHSGAYKEAALLYLEVIKQPAFRQQPPFVVETWKIFEAYLYFLQTAGLLGQDILPGKFKIQRFSNEILKYARDKSGMNIPVQIFYFIWNLAEGDYGQCIDREESMAKYRRRYISPEGAARSHYFIKMLEQLPRSAFSRVEAEKSCAGLLAEMKKAPLEAANQNHEVEIIPYETLWNIILSLLKHEKQGLRQTAIPA